MEALRRVHLDSVDEGLEQRPGTSGSPVNPNEITRSDCWPFQGRLELQGEDGVIYEVSQQTINAVARGGKLDFLPPPL